MRKLLAVTLSDTHLLKHPFYQAWNDGSLPMENLREYAVQYSHHVAAFPRYLSATHSLCESAQARKVLLENLVEEEGGEVNHPELWARFADGLGVRRSELNDAPAGQAVGVLIETFMRNAQTSYARGLGALYAYEHQVPEIAKFKQDALKKHFGVSDPRALMFFAVHEKADIEHREALEDLLGDLSDHEYEQAESAAKEAGQALWAFLDAMSPAGCMKMPAQNPITARTVADFVEP
jgi:pyrroloquinoline-quinone synthase